MKILKVSFLPLFFSIFYSCMGEIGEINPVRKRVVTSLKYNLNRDISIGSSDYSFSVCADPHIGGGENSLFEDILKDSSESGDKFSFVAGDLTNWGKKSQYEIYKKQIEKYTFSNGVFSVLGNHDIFGDGWENFKELFGPSVYSLNSENALFIVLDNANGTLGKEQFDWLEETLSMSSKEHIFVFMHFGVFTGTFSSFFKMASQEEIYRLIYILKKYDVDYVFSGHLHVYNVKDIEGIKFVITGGAGKGLLDSGSSHYVRVSVKAGKISVKKIDMN